MKYINLLWLLFGWTYVSYAQTVIIVDQESNEAIVGAVLISENPRVSEVSNAKGQAEISAFKNSTIIEIRATGYKTLTQSYSQIEASNFNISLEVTHLNLDEVVISANRWRESSSNIPAKVISIKTKDVALQNPQTAADLLGISGKVFVQKSQQGGGSPMIRGFATNRLVYTVDGVRMNTAIFRGGNLQNVINLDPFATENTEVLFGPGSVMYGSDAIGGVMSFQTLTPQLSSTKKPLVTGKAVTRFSSANKEFTGHFDVNVGWKKWAILTSFSAWDFDNLKQGSHGPDEYIKDIYAERQDSTDVVITQSDPLLQIPSAYSQMNLMQKIRFKPNENWDLEYAFHYSQTSSYGRYDRHNRFKNETLRYAEWNYGPQKWMMNQLSVKHQGSNVVYDQMALRIAQQSFEESRIDRSFNSDERNTNTEQVEAYSANLDFIKSVGKKSHFFYGLEYVLNDITSTGVLKDITTGEEEVGPSRYPNALWNSMGAYVNYELKTSEKFSLQTGLRYSHFIIDVDFTNNLSFYPFPFSSANVNNGALTGSLGVVYHPTKQWSLKANFGTAFRSPNVDDLGKVFDSEPGAVTVPNPDLKAEYGYNFDLGVAKIFGDWLKIDVTGYYTILQNAMVERDFQLNGQSTIMYDGVLSQVKAIQNAAVANIVGAQVGLEIYLPAGFSILSDFNYQYGIEELSDGTKSPSRHAPPMYGISRVRYKYKGLTLEVNTQYQGSKRYEELPESEQSKDEIYAKDENGNNYAPSWYSLNLKAMYQINKNFRVSGGIENITDQRYRPYSSGLSGAGRNFIISVSAHF